MSQDFLSQTYVSHIDLLQDPLPDVPWQPIETFLANPDALKPYTLILVTAPCRPEILEQLSTHASAFETPLFYIHSVGFYSHFSLQLPPVYPIVETHPNPESTSDLRLLAPWPELSQWAAEKTKDLDTMAADDHGHIPYIALLLHFLEVWKKEHDGALPSNYKEKTAFREMLGKAMRKDNPEGGEENFEEAIAAVAHSIELPEAKSSVKALFQEQECILLKPEASSFWVIAHAIGLFHTKHHVLPVPGSVPDMKARSKDYVELQNIYKAKARKDVAEVLESVRFIERTAQRTTQIDEKDVEAFCKNANFVRLVRGRPLQMVKSESKKRRQWGDRARPLGMCSLRCFRI